MPVVMLIAILVVLAGIVAVAVGHGGELSHAEPDHAPLDMGPMSATDVVLLRPPTVLWGYSTQITDQALERIAGAIRERDVRIVALEQRISELTEYDDYTPSSAARHARRNRQLYDAGFQAAAAPSGLGSALRPGPAASEPATAPAPESGYEADPGAGPSAPDQLAAEEQQLAAGEQPAAQEIAHDQAANRTDG